MDKQIKELPKITTMVQGNELIPVSALDGGGVYVKSISTKDINQFCFNQTFWIGTQEEYDNLTSKKTNVFYVLAE